MIRPLILLLPDEAAVMAAALQPHAADLGLPVDAHGRVDARELARRLARRELLVTVHGAATLLQGLRAVDAYQMRKAGPNRPRVRQLIADGELVYDRRDGLEHWQTWAELVGQLPGMAWLFGGRPQLRRRNPFVAGGDCEDLGAAWSAEMAVDGWDPAAVPVAYSSREGLSHVVVRSPRYGDIDPSRLAGMGWE